MGLFLCTVSLQPTFAGKGWYYIFKIERQGSAQVEVFFLQKEEKGGSRKQWKH
jgi:outer membrane protein assembly factor BamE (lipoprotein component of BamABCDE complex)